MPFEFIWSIWLVSDVEIYEDNDPSHEKPRASDQVNLSCLFV